MAFLLAPALLCLETYRRTAKTGFDIIRTGLLFFALASPVCGTYGQQKRADKLAESVDVFLEKSASAGDIEKLIDILGDDTEKFGAKFSYIPSINPLNPKRLKRFSGRFGNRFHPIDKRNKPHFGVDISAKAGTAIHAAASGTIKSTVRSDTGYGNQVTIEHGYGFKTRYAHMYLFMVEEGQSVKKGEIIGFVGSTGKSTGDHIHYELWKNNARIDPYPFCFLKI